MAVVYYTKNNTEYKIIKCTEQDIESDYELVIDIVKDIPKNVYTDNMLKSVQQGYAWRVYKNNELVGILYIYKDKNHWLGACIYGKDVMGIGLIVKELRDLLGKIKIKINPHNARELKQLKSIATGKSIRKYNNGQQYIILRVEDIEPKIHKLYKLLGVQKCH